MKLYAISDLHLGFEVNRNAIRALRAFPEDWLILAGDVCESEEHFVFALTELTARFQRVLWVPGNHELWAVPPVVDGQQGETKYRRFVTLCRTHNVLTPEDSYVRWPGEPDCLLAPLFVLYDYSFRPDHVPLEDAVAWSEERGVVCADEVFLRPDPYASRSDWCRARLDYTEGRLAEVAARGPLVLINHWPLRRDLLHLGRIPSFSLWCGTRNTEDWHTRFPVLAVVSGHLHVRSRSLRDGVRFEEVSLGYPRDWVQERGVEFYLREVLPGPQQPRFGFLNPGKF